MRQAVIGVLYTAILWVFVPLLILTELQFSARIVQYATSRDSVPSAGYGQWAGLIAIGVLAMSYADTIKASDLSVRVALPLDWMLVLIGAFAGAAYVAGAGSAAMLPATAMLWAQYSYVFAETSRMTIAQLAVGAMLGALLVLIMVPRALVAE